MLVLRNAGPKGVPGFPEWGMIPVPTKLLQQGVTDMVRISDSRMSGTSYGTVVLHVSPEAAAGGPLALVQNGDPIELDVERRRLELLIEPAELERRRQVLAAPRLAASPRLSAASTSITCCRRTRGPTSTSSGRGATTICDFVEPTVGRS